MPVALSVSLPNAADVLIRLRPVADTANQTRVLGRAVATESAREDVIHITFAYFEARTTFFAAPLSAQEY